MPTPIAAVIFDMDETLLNRQASLVRFAAAQHNRYHQFLRHVPVQAYASRFVELDDNGRLWKDEVYRILLDEYAVRGLGWQELLDDYISDFRNHCIIYPGTRAALDELRQDGRRLGLITNGPYPLQLHNFQSLGLDEYFPVVLVSGQEGMRKPDPEIFHRALKRLDVPPEAAVYVGDNPDADIAGAQAAGMRTVWRGSVYWPQTPDAHATCLDIRNLPAVIRQLEAAPPPAEASR